MTKEAALNLAAAAIMSEDFSDNILAGTITETEIMDGYEGAEFPDAAAVVAAVLNAESLPDIRVYMKSFIQTRYGGERSNEEP